MGLSVKFLGKRNWGCQKKRGARQPGPKGGILWASSLPVRWSGGVLCSTSGVRGGALADKWLSDISSPPVASLVHAFITSSIDGCNTMLAGLPRTITDRLQCLLNAAALVISNTGKYLQGRAPQYLMNCCHPTSDVASRQRLRSSSRHHLVVPRHRRSTLSCWVFSVTGPMAWNALPDDLRDLSLSADNFRKRLKTHLFRNALGHSAH